ncbi:MAG: MFS transporter [Bacteroidales bacterium]|nr:MFS transporter [Bacteroidales bacterium]
MIYTLCKKYQHNHLLRRAISAMALCLHLIPDTGFLRTFAFSYQYIGMSKDNKKFHYGYVIVACCCLIMGVNIGLVLSCAGIFYQPVSEGLGVSVGKFGMYMSFNYIVSTLVLPTAGKLIERYSARWLLTGSSALLGLTLIAMSRFTEAWQFYVAGGVIGLAMSFQLYLSFPTLVNRWFHTRVGFFMGLCSAASGIGGILFNPVGASLITSYGWQTAYAVFGGLILIVVSPVLGLLLRDRPESMGLTPYGAGESKETTVTTEGIMYDHAIRMPAFYALFVFALLIMAVSTLNLFIPNYVKGLSFSLSEASFAASSVMAGVTIGKIVLGLINDRNSQMGVLTTVLCGICGLGLLLAGRMGFSAVLGGAFLFGWAYAGVTVQTPMLVRSVFGSRDYARIYSNISIAISIGGAVSSGVWGLLADHTSYAFILSLGILFLSICGVIGLGVLRSKRQSTQTR